MQFQSLTQYNPEYPSRTQDNDGVDGSQLGRKPDQQLGCKRLFVQKLKCVLSIGLIYCSWLRWSLPDLKPYISNMFDITDSTSDCLRGSPTTANKKEQTGKSNHLDVVIIVKQPADDVDHPLHVFFYWSHVIKRVSVDLWILIVTTNTRCALQFWTNALVCVYRGL